MVKLLTDLQQDLKLTYLFIAHDLSMVKHISNGVAVMYLGNIVEIAQSDELYDKPAYHYTKALISAIPVPDPDVEKDRQRILLEGDMPSPINPKPGCKFRERCKYAKPVCTEARPPNERD